MTTVSTVEYIIEAMDSDPLLLEALRARLLTRDLLELPVIVAKLAASQAETRGDMALFAASQATLREEMIRIATSQAELWKEMTRFATSQAELREEMTRLAASQTEMRAELTRLAASQTELREEMAQLAASHLKLADAVAVLTGEVAVLKDDVSALKGDHLEMQLQKKIHAMLGQRKRLRRVRIVSATFPAGMNLQFADAIDDAADAGTITEDQRVRIMATDLIATARRQRSPQTIYVSFEAAHSLNEDDVRRVLETGDVLSRVFPEAEVMSFVYGQAISARDMSQAKAKGVEVVLERSPR